MAEAFDKVTAIRDFMLRQNKRYNDTLDRINMAARDGAFKGHPADETIQRSKMRDWWKDLLDDAAREYASAINEAENIVAGKQWLFDSRPTLTRDHNTTPQRLLPPR